MTETTAQPYIQSAIMRRNVLFVILDGIAIGLISAGGTFISVFVVRLGASPFWVSLLSSIPSTIALVMTIPWSRLVEGQPKPQFMLAWARLVGYMMYLPVAILPFFLHGEWAARAIVILWSLNALSSSLTSITFALVMGFAVTPDRRAFLMSRRWIVLGLAQALALPVVSWLIGNLPFPYGYQVVFGANFVIAFWSFICTRQIQVLRSSAGSGGPSASRNKPLSLSDSIRQSLAEIWAAKPFLAFSSGKVLYNLGLAMVSAMINIYWINHLKFSDTWVGYMTTTATVATLVSYLPWVRIKRKIGTQKLVIISVLGSSLYPALLALVSTPVATLPVVALNGLVIAALNLAFFDALLDVCPAGKEERFVAINAVLVYLTGIVGPPTGAMLLNVLDIRWVLALGTLVALTGTGVFVRASVGIKKNSSQTREKNDNAIT